MKTKHLFLLGLIAAFSSCSTAYHTGQTPDDVYFSPAPPAQETYVTSKNQQDRNSYYQDDEEQEIRRGIQNPSYRSNIALDFGYGYNPYTYNSLGFNNSFYNPYAYNSFGSYGYKGIYDPYGYNSYGYNPYSFSPYSYNNFGYYGNSFYNPYYSGYYPPVYAYPRVGYINTNVNTGPRRVNLAAYNNTGNSRIGRTAPSNQSSVPVRSFIEARQGTGVGNVIRRVFTPSESRTYTQPSNNRTYNNENNTRTNTAPVRTFENSPSVNTTNSNSSSSGSGGSAPVRTFRRG